MPDEVRERFAKSTDISFDVEEEFRLAAEQRHKPKAVIDKSIRQHAIMCIENSESVPEARKLARLLDPDIEYRVKQYAKLLAKTTKNYREWLIEDYKNRLGVMIGSIFYQFHSDE